METTFTPFASLTGGVLIGLSAVLLMVLHGRIAGISGIVAGVFGRADTTDKGWRSAFVLGLLAPGALLVLFRSSPDTTFVAGPPVLLVAGLLVGFGTRLGSGCTSGHGVCGLARLSPRSLAAVAGFMGAGFITVGILRHLLALPS